MEDLEFQKLEREINQDEEKENQSQELLREIAECQRLTVTRKVWYDQSGFMNERLVCRADTAGTASPN